MADETIEKERDQLLIAEINAIQDELVNLKVLREKFHPAKMTTAQLLEMAEAKREQLKRRRKFLGVK